MGWKQKVGEGAVNKVQTAKENETGRGEGTKNCYCVQYCAHGILLRNGHFRGESRGNFRISLRFITHNRMCDGVSLCGSHREKSLSIQYENIQCARFIQYSILPFASGKLRYTIKECEV